jgi:hypothetical protein
MNRRRRRLPIGDVVPAAEHLRASHVTHMGPMPASLVRSNNFPPISRQWGCHKTRAQRNCLPSSGRTHTQCRQRPLTTPAAGLHPGVQFEGYA